MGRAASSFNARWEQVVANIVTSSATDGVGCTANASANTKGNWATNSAYKPTFSWNLMRVTLWNANAGDYTVDIGIDDGSSNVFVICPDLRIPGRKIARGGMCHYLLPLHVPEGKQLAFRCQSSTGSNAARVIIAGCSNGIYGAQGYSRMVALYTPATSRGVQVDPGASAHNKGAWAQLTSSSSDRVVAVMGAIGHEADTARAANQTAVVDIGIGAGGSERVLLPDIPFVSETNLDQWMPMTAGPFPCDVPSGTRFAARAQCDVATAGDRLLDFALWGFVP